MSSIYYFESLNAQAEVPLLLQLASELSSKGGGEEVYVITEARPLGDDQSDCSLEGYAVTNTLVETVPIDEPVIFRKLCNESVQNKTYLLISTHDAASKYFLDRQTLAEKPHYGPGSVIYLHRPESVLTLDVAFRGKSSSYKVDEFFKGRSVYKVGCSVDENVVVDRLRSDILKKLRPLAERKERDMELVKTGRKPNVPNVDAKTQILMSKNNPDGITIEELFTCLIQELQIKQDYISNDTGITAEVIKKNNVETIQLLKKCLQYQRLNRHALDSIRKDEGPTGVPRVGA